MFWLSQEVLKVNNKEAPSKEAPPLIPDSEGANAMEEERISETSEDEEQEVCNS